MRPFIAALVVTCVSYLSQGSLHARIVQQIERSTFEVVSVKTLPSDTSGVSMGLRAGTFRGYNISVRDVLLVAFQQNGRPLLRDQVVEAPDWVSTARFEIVGKVSAELAAEPSKASARLPEMLRALLEERFGLVARREMRETQVYALLKSRADGRLGPQLRPSDKDCLSQGRGAVAQAGNGRATGGVPCGIRLGPGTLAGGAMELPNLATLLSGQVGRITLDKTGLSGGYDVELSWAPELVSAAIDNRPGSGMPSIFTAVQEQLGLKLETQLAPVEVLVIDRIQRPTPN